MTDSFAPKFYSFIQNNIGNELNCVKCEQTIIQIGIASYENSQRIVDNQRTFSLMFVNVKYCIHSQNLPSIESVVVGDRRVVVVVGGGVVVLTVVGAVGRGVVVVVVVVVTGGLYELHVWQHLSW